ncbi:MAG: GDSL-type esterase/lipase family protein [Treponema sp.]|jgi:acyl-CoA thioesterase-1|nr:GDSL-type esterase/lipase family protein [Treponema sp.]
MRKTKILWRAAVGMAAAFLVSLTTGCDHGVNEAEPWLEKWTGTWNSLSSYLDESSMGSVYKTFAQTISAETQRTIGASDVEAFVKKVFSTPFASFKIAGNTITFYPDQDAGGEPIAAGTYTFRQKTCDQYYFEDSQANDYRYWIANPPGQGEPRFFFAYDSAGFDAAVGKTGRARPTAVPAGTPATQAAVHLTALMSQIPVFSTWGRGEKLVCLGDSLTAGYGAVEQGKEDKSKSYPVYLQEKVNIPVVNKGVSGVSSDYGLLQIDSILETENPRILIIELGANDYLLWGVPVNKTHENLQAVIDRANDGQREIYLAKFYTEQMAEDIEADAETIEQYDDMFNALSSNDNVELISDIWDGVWGNPALMSDTHHPNAEGYAIMADNYFNALKPYLTANNLTK